MAEIGFIEPTATNPATWIRKAAERINYLLRKTGDYASATALSALETLVGQKTGWGNYADTAGAQTLATGVRTVFTNNAGTTIETQKPSDVTAFWAANKITGRTGDAILVKVQCRFTPADGTASEIRFEVDIGGGIGVVEEQQFTIAGGAAIAHPISWTFAAYTLDTWETNGGTIFVTADGPGDLTIKRVVVQRTHKARP